MFSRIWPHVRGVLVALHVIAITLLALPAPDGAMNREAWKQPTVQDELKTWTESLNNCGIDISQPELEDRLWKLASGYMDIRSDVLSPFELYYNSCGTFQAWRMFSGPQRYPAVLHIDISERGEWRPVYIQRDSQHRWLARQLDSYRFRAFLFRLGSLGSDSECEAFARWVAARAATDFHDAERVRVRFFQFTLRTAAEVRAGAPIEGEFVRSVELPLEPRARP